MENRTDTERRGYGKTNLEDFAPVQEGRKGEGVGKREDGDKYKDFTAG